MNSLPKNQQFCTACGKITSNINAHPILEVGICGSCQATYFSGEFAVESDNGNEDYCRWCGEGSGKLLLCDSCPKTFCSGCITRNFGLSECNRLLGLEDRWKCFVCSPQPIEDLFELNGWVKIHSSNSESVKTAPRLPEHCICEDISRGREKFPIPAFNEFDDDPAPLDFVYVTSFVSGGAAMTNNPNLLPCCTCTDNCKDATKCECALRMNGFAYDKDKILVSEKLDGIYECNQRCSCHVDRCRNRVVGKGPNLPLQVFRCSSAAKGWGVRCTEPIYPGSYVADYLGELLSENDADLRGLCLGDGYLFSQDQYPRSVGCQRLLELGMKTPLPQIPREVDVNVGVVSRNDLKELLGDKMVQLLEEKGAIARAQDICYPVNATHSTAHHVDDTNSRSKKTGRKDIRVPLDIGLSPVKKNKSVINHKIDNQNKSASIPANNPTPPHSSTISRPLNWFETVSNDRSKAHRAAREILIDRAMTETEEAGEVLTIDARWFGSVGRFLNHSCSPNLEKVSVFVDSHDSRMPRVAFFALEYIPAMTELCYDYGYKPGIVEGNHLKCLCSSAKCRKVLY